MRCQAAGGQVTLRPMPDNDDARPRATLLLTRPRAMSERFADEITDYGLPADIVIAPLMEIVSLEAPSIPDEAELIFTSSNAVPVAGPGKSRRAWCVGPRTEQTAREAGFDAILAGADADALIARIQQDRPSSPLLHLRGRHQRGDVEGRLSKAGFSITSNVVYDQVDIAPTAAFTAALRRSPLIVPLFSPRSAALFTQAAGSTWQPTGDDTIIALSTAVVSALPSGWSEKTIVTKRPDGPSMLQDIARRISPSGDNGGVTRY